MTTFRIKVCGITRVADALLAAELGADMIGMIFYRRSPRFLTMKKARAIVKSLPPTVRPVGVFVDESPDRMISLGTKLHLDFIQLHGNEPVGHVRALQKAGLGVIKAFHVRTQADYRRLYLSRADLVLLDNASSGLPGGTGRAFDWSLRPPRPISNLVLAGGLAVHNVAKGVKRFGPLVVDVNSGVEDSPGMKSHIKMREFFKMCNRLRYEAKK